MTSQQLHLVAPSGARVRVGLPAGAPVANVVAGVRFAGGSFGSGFQIGPRGYHDFACTTVAPARLRDRFPVHGREVVVAEAADQRSAVATLMGDYHELMTVYAGPAPGRDRVSALFASLRVADQVAGMVVRPRAVTLADTAAEQLIVVVRDRGSLSIPGPRQALALRPRHAGARTRHGEVWKAPYPGRRGAAGGPATVGGHSFILGCPAGLAEVHLAAGPGRAEDELLDWLDGIDVAWHGVG